MTPPTKIPDEILSAHRGWTIDRPWDGEWANTVRLVSTTGDTRFAKIGWAGRYPTPTEERERMSWCRPYVPVPEILGYGTEDDLDWFVTSALPGVDATIEKHTIPPDELVPLLGRGLRAWHESLPVADCPFDFTLDVALEHCARRVNDDTITWDGFRGRNERLTPAEALAKLERDRPATEDLVVCHGDYCFPNVFIEDGAIVGYLDLGELGVADRWWDLAIGGWSVTWNVDPSLEPLFYEGYGIEPDEDRIWYFRTLYEVVA